MGKPRHHLPDPWSAIRLSFLVALAATLVGFVPAVWLGWVLARKDFFGKVVGCHGGPGAPCSPAGGYGLHPSQRPRDPGLHSGAWLAGLGSPHSLHPPGGNVGGPHRGPSPVRRFGSERFPGGGSRAMRRSPGPWDVVPGRPFVRVTFPLALPGIAAGAVLAFARALGEFGATVVLAGNIEGSTRTIALAVYTLLESPQGREAIWVLVGASVVLSLLALLGFEALSRHQRKQIGGRRGR